MSGKEIGYWTSGRIRFALARYFNWRQHVMMSEWTIDGGIADLLFISRSGYATEIEIKISRADWKADRHKQKFDRERPHIARFFYAVPETLADSQPEWTPEYTGLLIVRAAHNSYSFDEVTEARAAIRRPAQKMSDREIARVHRSAYFRFWEQEMARLQVRLYDRPQMRRARPG